MNATTNDTSIVSETEEAVVTTRFERLPGKGALFAKADRETGEIVKITGEYVTPEGMVLILDGLPLSDGSISLTGRVANSKHNIAVEGTLTPQAYDPSYKAGSIIIGSNTKKPRVVKVNSHSRVDRNGLPFRFMWHSNNVVRAAF